MKVRSVILAVGLVVGGGFQGVALGAEDSRVLPTLLIKGEVVSLDANDPSATLLKVKDRYGFETPIYLEQGTTITQGEAAVEAASLTAGAAVEVEYNFDVNTAKRHAVSVKLAAAAMEATPTAPAGAAAQPTAPAPADAGAAATSSPQPTSEPAAAPESQAPSAETPASEPVDTTAPATAPSTTQ